DARLSHTATLLADGKVVVTGGQGLSGYLKSTELYDPTSNTWTSQGDMGSTRETQTATLLSNGEVLVAGGYNGSDLPSADLFDPSRGTSAIADIQPRFAPVTGLITS